MLQNRFLYWTDRIYTLFIKAGGNLKSLFLLYMRVMWGHQLFLMGLKKFHTMDQVVALFDSLHIFAPTFSAYFVATSETVCGLCLFLGLASRLAAIPVALIMITALSTAHASVLADLKFLFHPTILVHEAPYPYVLTALLVFIFGPGRVSLDGWIKRWVNRQPKW